MNELDGIIFFGNWGLGAKTLAKLLADEMPVVAVVTQHDSETTDPYYNAVYSLALEHTIPVYTDYCLIPVAVLARSVGISVAFNKIFRADILRQLTIVNFHPGPLPKYKGPSAIEWQIKHHEKEIGMTAHLVDAGIDTGPIIAHEYFRVNYKNSFFNDFLDEFNDYFSSFIATLTKKLLTEPIRASAEENQPGNYLSRISVPSSVKKLLLESVAQYMNRKRIAIFTGNRAEFGILFPLLIELSNAYMIDLFVSGAHLIEPWMTIAEVRAKLRTNDLPINIMEFPIRESSDYYRDVFQQLFPAVNKHFLKQEGCAQYELSICLGDRVETLVFAQASFFSRIPVLHIFGGDVANVPYFDTNVRHAISKFSHLHFVSNEISEKVIWQLGEEKWRVKNIGNLALDYDRLGELPSKESLQKQFQLEHDRIVVVATYHASQFKDEADNLSDFMQFLTPLLECEDCYVILTYPNNDPGGELIMKKIHLLEEGKYTHLKIVPNLGTMNYHGILKHFRAIVAGNSSSGLMETSFHNTPAINIGDRQTDRSRGSNVYDTGLDVSEIRQVLRKIVLNYEGEKIINEKSRYYFGNGTGALQAKKYIAEYLLLSKDQLINKRFERM